MWELGIQMVPAYWPLRAQLWQRRLPQELRLRGIQTVEQANRFPRQEYIGEFNRRFRAAAGQSGSAFVPLTGQDLERIFSLQHTRVVNRDNTVQFENLCLRIEPLQWRGTLAGCQVTVHRHLDGTLSLRYGQHRLGRHTAQGGAIETPAATAKTTARSMEKTAAKQPPWKSLRDSHFPTLPAAAEL